jgi:hypothetical protein
MNVQIYYIITFCLHIYSLTNAIYNIISIDNQMPIPPLDRPGLGPKFLPGRGVPALGGAIKTQC